jgi:hypothetical protein
LLFASPLIPPRRYPTPHLNTAQYRTLTQCGSEQLVPAEQRDDVQACTHNTHTRSATYITNTHTTHTHNTRATHSTQVRRSVTTFPSYISDTHTSPPALRLFRRIPPPLCSNHSLPYNCSSPRYATQAAAAWHQNNLFGVVSGSKKEERREERRGKEEEKKRD